MKFSVYVGPYVVVSGLKRHRQERDGLSKGAIVSGPTFQYLVVLSHTMDDFPLQLVNDSEQAFEIAKAAEWYPPESMSRVLELPDCSTPCIIAVWMFRDGVPTGRVVVRDWEDEAD